MTLDGRSEPSSPEFEAILFDLFGTLVPTGSQAARRANLEEMGRALEVDVGAFADRWFATFDERARGRFGNLEETIERLARELGGDPTPRQIEIAARARLDYARALLRAGRRSLVPLDALRSAGPRLGVVSDTSEDTVRIWPTSELASRFDVAAFSCDLGIRKPDPEIYRVAVERLGVRADRVAYVGDGGSHELTGAEAFGLSAFQYVFPEPTEDAYRIDREPDWSGPRLGDLAELLKRLTRPP